MTMDNQGENAYALRIEGRKWLNDITVAQVWAVLRAAYQELEQERELLFMIMLPNGEQPSLCLERRLFEALMTSPEAMERRLTLHSTRKMRFDGDAAESTGIRHTASAG